MKSAYAITKMRKTGYSKKIFYTEALDLYKKVSFFLMKLVFSSLSLPILSLVTASFSMKTSNAPPLEKKERNPSFTDLQSRLGTYHPPRH